MYDIQLMHIYGSSHFCSGKYAVGVYLDKSSRSAILIDSGSDENIARAIDKEITNRGYRISGILHTHGHRNNFGGDRYFLENYPEVRIYSTPSAVAWVSHEAIYCGEIPFQHAHREPIPATDLLEDRDGSFLIGEAEFKVVALPGHVPGMVGFISPDNVLYCGDALFGEKILKKQNLLLYMDIGAAKRTFRKLVELGPKAYVLYHGGVYYDVSELIDQHLSWMSLMFTFVENRINQQPVTLETLVQQAMAHFGLEDGAEQYALTVNIVRAYVVELLELERIKAAVKQGKLYFEYR